MSKITFNLDETTLALAEQAAKACGLSISGWVSAIIHDEVTHQWPGNCIALAGAFADFPLREDDQACQPKDVPGISF